MDSPFHVIYVYTIEYKYDLSGEWQTIQRGRCDLHRNVGLHHIFIGGKLATARSRRTATSIILTSDYGIEHLVNSAVLREGRVSEFVFCGDFLADREMAGATS